MITVYGGMTFYLFCLFLSMLIPQRCGTQRSDWASSSHTGSGPGQQEMGNRQWDQDVHFKEITRSNWVRKRQRCIFLAGYLDDAFVGSISCKISQNPAALLSWRLQQTLSTQNDRNCPKGKGLSSDFPISNPEFFERYKQATQMYFDQKHLKRNWKQLKLAQMKMYLLSEILGIQLFSSTLGRLSPTVKKVRMEWEKSLCGPTFTPINFKSSPF